MWELPAVDETPFRPGPLLAEVRHAITHHRITLRAFAGEAVDGVRPAGDRWRWVSDRELRRLTLPSAHRKLVAVLRQGKTAGFDRLSGGP
jgi:adenine-specific DNA glycosylase